MLVLVLVLLLLLPWSPTSLDLCAFLLACVATVPFGSYSSVDLTAPREADIFFVSRVILKTPSNGRGSTLACFVHK
jgi:hypothetical protein